MTWPGEAINPPTPNAEWLTQVPVLGDLVGALLAGGVLLSVGLLVAGALAWGVARGLGLNRTRGGQGVIAAVLAACVIASLPGLISAVPLAANTTSWHVETRK